MAIVGAAGSDGSTKAESDSRHRSQRLPLRGLRPSAGRLDDAAGTRERPRASAPDGDAAGRAPDAGRFHLTGLDGLRALAVAAVLLYHGGNNWLPAGFLGVDLFFVISGFLITTLILEELRSTGHDRPEELPRPPRRDASSPRSRSCSA